MKKNGVEKSSARQIFLLVGALAFFCAAGSLWFQFEAYVHARRLPADPIPPALIQLSLLCGSVSLAGGFGLLGFLLLRKRASSEAVFELQANHAQMLHASRMTALGEMAGSVAHEINNPLAVIQIRNAQLLEAVERGGATPEETKKACETVEAMCVRITRVINSMRLIARESGQDGSSMVSVRKLIDESLVLAKDRLRRQGVELEIQPIPAGLDVFCNETQVAQILLHLIANAADALADTKGPRRVSVGAVAIGKMVHFQVRDNGSGVPAHLREKIFSPFFTTRSAGGGSGLGLSISRGLAASQGGELCLDVEAEETTFVLVLPNAPDAVKKEGNNGKKISA